VSIRLLMLSKIRTRNSRASLSWK